MRARELEDSDGGSEAGDMYNSPSRPYEREETS